ncbi:MAG: ATP-binding protein [bacterium]|nr:ATP-binding protein [bacterium]
MISNQKVAPDVIILSLERPEKFAFTPGQYVWLVMPKRTERYGVVDRRAYSISSSVQSKDIELLIRITDNEYLQDVAILKTGDKVDIIGPMGSAFIVPSQGAIMIGGGTGVAPFLSCVRSGLDETMSLIAYHSKERPLHCKKDIEELATQHRYDIALHEGVPQKDDFSNVTKENNKRLVFIAGPQGFVDNVTALLLSAGIASSAMRYEALYPCSEICNTTREMFENPIGSFSKDEKGVRQDPARFSELGHLFFMVAKQTTNHVIITDPNGVILFANEAAEKTTGYTFKEMVGQTPRLWGALMPAPFYKELWVKKSAGMKLVYKVLNRSRDGRLYVSLVRVTPLMQDKSVIAYVATEEDITDLMQLDKAKTEFVSLASHQLRTPLSTVNWYAEMLLAGDAGKINKEQKKYVEEIYNGNQRMVELVNALLNVSRIELGTFLIEPQPTNVAELARSVMDEQRPAIDEKKILLKPNLADNLPIIQIDPKLLRMVFQNLLSNAVKYTPEGGTVELDLRVDSDCIVIKVADTGYGIPKPQQDKIFTKLFRADNVRKKDTEGTGLGLYIVKSIIDHSGGKVWFESPARQSPDGSSRMAGGEENPGTVFYVTLPISGMMKKVGTKSLS